MGLNEYNNIFFKYTSRRGLPILNTSKGKYATINSSTAVDKSRVACIVLIE